MECASQLPVFSIFTGDSKTMQLAAFYAGFGGPLDLTSCTEIVITLPNADGTFTLLKLSLTQVAIISPAVLGKFSALISAVNSAKLQIGELQTFNVTFTISGSIFTVPYVNALSVFETEP